MPEDFFEAQYDITKKSKIKKFYESNKILIFSSILILVILFGSLSFYLESKEKQKTLLSENYIKAKIYLENGNKNEALNVLKKIIVANDPIYSTLSSIRPRIRTPTPGIPTTNRFKPVTRSAATDHT